MYFSQCICYVVVRFVCGQTEPVWVQVLYGKCLERKKVGFVRNIHYSRGLQTSSHLCTLLSNPYTKELPLVSNQNIELCPYMM